jgi:hypothetical protein
VQPGLYSIQQRMNRALCTTKYSGSNYDIQSKPYSSKPRSVFLSITKTQNCHLAGFTSEIGGDQVAERGTPYRPTDSRVTLFARFISMRTTVQQVHPRTTCLLHLVPNVSLCLYSCLTRRGCRAVEDSPTSRVQALRRYDIQSPSVGNHSRSLTCSCSLASAPAGSLH